MKIAQGMNSLPKFIFSRTVDKVVWNNTTIIRDNVADEIAKLKQQPGKDLMMFGGANLASTLMKLGLFDEYRLLLSPIVLGGGTPLFQGGYDRFHLKLIEDKPFDTGAIMLRYEPVR